MKIILTGATGFVGSEVLAALLARPDVEVVTCISRRPLDLAHPKLSTILHKDFTSYDNDLAGMFAQHDACIWTLGGKAADIVDPDEHRRITCDFTMALANALAPRIRRRFVFCYLSGMGADQSETAWFPWERLTRHLKGRTERHLIALAGRQPALKIHCFRPGGILPRRSSRLMRFVTAPITVGVELLAKSLIHVVVEERFDNIAVVIRNRDIKWMGTAR